MSQRVFVAMSGGVDSAAAAPLLRQAGYNVTGVTPRLHPYKDRPGLCGSADDIETARAVAAGMGIPPCGAGPVRSVPRAGHGPVCVGLHPRPHTQSPALTATGDQVRRPAGLGAGPGRGRHGHRPLRQSPPRYALRPLATAAGRGSTEGPDVLPLSVDPAPAGPSACCRWETMKSLPCGPWRPPTACPTPRRPTARTSALCRMGTMCRFCGSMAAWSPSPVTSWTQKAVCWAATGEWNAIPSASGKGWASAPTRRCTCWGKDPDRNAVILGEDNRLYTRELTAGG